MERNKLLTIAVIGLLLINLGTISFLWLRKPPHPEQQKEEKFKIIIDKLEFNAEQQKKYMNLVHAHHQSFEKLNEATCNLRRDYYYLMKNDAIDRIQADSLNTLIGKNQSEINQLNFEHFLNIKALCDEHQKVLFNNFVGEIGRLFNPPPKRR